MILPSGRTTEPTVRLNLRFSQFGSSHHSTGGAFSLTNSRLLLSGSDCSFNSAEKGGCIFAGSQSTVTLTSTIVASNRAVDGGGIALRGDIAFVARAESRLFSNSATRFGGAILLQDTPCLSKVVLNESCSVKENIAGAGDFVYYQDDGGRSPESTPLPRCLITTIGISVSQEAATEFGSYPYSLQQAQASPNAQVGLPFSVTARVVDYFGHQWVLSKGGTAWDSNVNVCLICEGKCKLLPGFVASATSNASFISYHGLSSESAESFPLLLTTNKTECIQSTAPLPASSLEFSIVLSRPFPPGPPAAGAPAANSGSASALWIGLGIAIPVAIVVAVLALRWRKDCAGVGAGEAIPLLNAGASTDSRLHRFLEEARIPLVELSDLEVTKSLGSGATGIVSAATWLSHKQDVAVKHLNPSIAAEVRRCVLLEIV